MSLLAGHAQTTFISLMMLALWVARNLVRDLRGVRAEMLAAHRSGLYTPGVSWAWWSYLWRNLAPLLLILIVGGLLAAIQLVPTQFLSSLSPRAGGLTLREAAAFSLDPRILPRALLPTFGQDVPLLSEYVGWVGFTGLALALLGFMAVGWRRGISGASRAWDFGVLASATGLLLAFGGYNPLFWLLWRVVPGFDLFRAPARWLLLYALGMAVLAGMGTENGGRRTEESRNQKPETRLRRTTDDRLRITDYGLRITNYGLLAVVVALTLLLFLLFGAWPSLRVLPWWVGAAVGAVGLMVARLHWREGWRVSLLISSQCSRRLRPRASSP
jgi:hypothetical protein